MGTNTPDYNFYKPTAGEDGWATLVNDSFDDLDDLLSGDQILVAIANKNYIETQVTDTQSTTYSVDLSQGNIHKLTLTGDVTIDFTNVDATNVNSVVLHLVQDGTGGRTPSFTPTVVWDGGNTPSWSTSANAEDVVTLVHDQDGDKWLGFVGGLGMA